MSTQWYAHDRTVHAWYYTDTEGLPEYLVEVVRYDQAGKWFVEWSTGRKQVTVREAVAAAKEGMRHHLGKATLGLQGGSTFDRMIQVA